MAKLQTLPATTSAEDLINIIKTDGAVIVKDLASPAEIAAVRAEIMPYVEATPTGTDDFTGNRTTRTGALVARSQTCRDLILNPLLEEMCTLFLKPNCSEYQLHLGQVIRIMPGQTAQAIHRDRWAWGPYLKGIEPQLNTIWAVSDFTRENGATQVVPGSLDWPDDRRPTEDEITYAEMSAGSVLIYSGTVFHGGGENTSDGDRIGLNLTYTLGWLRQEENQYLSCPPEIARTLDPKLQKLIGYQLGSYALGYYTPPLPPGEGPEAVSPAYALSGDVSGTGLGNAQLLSSLSEAFDREATG